MYDLSVSDIDADMGDLLLADEIARSTEEHEVSRLKILDAGRHLLVELFGVRGDAVVAVHDDLASVIYLLGCVSREKMTVHEEGEPYKSAAVKTLA
jgi:hypothetical protein